MSTPDPVPEAALRRRRRLPLWLVPLAGALLAGALVYQSLSQRGIPVSVEFAQGHGLKPGDSLRYRGIVVGKVESVVLAEGLGGIDVQVRLMPEATDLARAGSRFWIVRPQLDLSGATGLDTLLGANYLAVLPGRGEPQYRFRGLEEPPLGETLEPGGLELVLQAPERGGLRAGAGVTYRGVRVGTVLSVALASDASAAEARIYIQRAYAPLVRERTRFWQTGGLRLSGGLTGFSLDVQSLPALLGGGVSLATPPQAGEAVRNGHRFPLQETPQPEWLEWAPALHLGHPSLPEGRSLPAPLWAVTTWAQKDLLLLTHRPQRQGWVLPLADGLLGPADLLAPPVKTVAGSAYLEVAGRRLPLQAEAATMVSAVALLPHVSVGQPAAKLPQRRAEAPEDTLVVGDPRSAPRFVSAARYTPKGDHWEVDAAEPFGPEWHGAAVVATRDGALLGVLVMGDAGAEVYPLPKY